jgi:hypothetical protein
MGTRDITASPSGVTENAAEDIIWAELSTARKRLSKHDLTKLYVPVE